MVFRAISCLKKLPLANQSRALTPSDIRDAEVFWIKQTQSAHFSEEIKILTESKRFAKSHSLLRLVTFVDEHGLLCVGGRLQNAHLEPDAKHAIILLRESAFTRLILNETHTRTLHGGVQPCFQS